MKVYILVLYDWGKQLEKPSKEYVSNGTKCRSMERIHSETRKVWYRSRIIPREAATVKIYLLFKLYFISEEDIEDIYLPIG